VPEEALVATVVSHHVGEVGIQTRQQIGLSAAARLGDRAKNFSGADLDVHRAARRGYVGERVQVDIRTAEALGERHRLQPAWHSHRSALGKRVQL
jgi:hypothetical protein